MRKLRLFALALIVQSVITFPGIQARELHRGNIAGSWKKTCKARKEVINELLLITHPNLQQFEWLLGAWAGNTGEGEFFEIWTRTNDSVFSAESYLIVGQDTVFSETISLESINGDLYYRVMTSNQNEGRTVAFKLISSLDGEFIFENKDHDFPQRIIYKHLIPDQLHARIEGLMNGEPAHEDFHLKKMMK
ncbi:MAG: DUF6265 family protein [Acidobacteria bacterium]|jgi:hypothetical protein|nr:DUF6265 family protein [Acidobacteriota bacterium]